MIFLFTDFGANDIYLGQVMAVLQRHAPDIPAIDLLHNAPAFEVRAAAHLLAASIKQAEQGDVIVAVVDPGVGGERAALVVQADGIWLVGPDNGLMSVVVARANEARVWRIVWRPPGLSNSFHGRDLFAPVAVQLARGEFPTNKLETSTLSVDFGAADLPEIIYLDHYGNGFTGLRAAALSRTAELMVSNLALRFAEVFSRVPCGTPFWYQNSVGVVEIAVNCGSASQLLGLRIGQTVALREPA